jgi:DNA uptake protein ComE-like DNA-binding protein
MKKTLTGMCALLLALMFVASQVQAQTTSSESDQNSSKHSRSKHKEDNSGKATAQGQVDVNSASKEELEALPGIGPALADKILQNRPYKAKRELVSRNVIPESTYKKVKDQLVAHRTSEQSNRGSSSAGASSSRSEEERSDSSTKSENAEGTGSESTGRQPESAASQESRSDKSTSTDETTSAQTPPEKGMVWVNLRTEIYHREGDRWYGKTKQGKFISEADAVKEGYRAAKNGPKAN